MNSVTRGLAHLAGSLAIAAFCYGLAHAGGVNALGVTPTSVDEGDTRVPFNVGCASTTWTVLAASDSIRRAILMHTSAQNVGGVCIGTGPAASGVACGDTTNGVELSSASFNDSGKASIFCRSRPGTSTGTLRGFIYRDTRDFGYISR